jgi:ferric-dicitrate binding protein FerR (iron transport regulator)
MDDDFNRNMLSWKTGILYFDQCPMDEVARHLENLYNIHVILGENVLADETFTSTIDNQELEEVLEEIAMVMGLEYTLGEDQVFISKPD